jgi:hypothetical protein
VKGTTTWLTSPVILDALGGWQSFDFDPCAAPEPRPWPTALRMNARADGNGLAMRWQGRVFLNPPYTGTEIARWLARMAEHDHGTALLFARTQTEAWKRYVWRRAAGLLFLFGRLHFHDADGTRAPKCGGAPGVLCAYGQDDLDRLADLELDGAFVPLRFPRFAVVIALDRSWPAMVVGWLRGQEGPVTVAAAYRHFAAHAKARSNRHLKAKLRQVLGEVAQRVEPGIFRLEATR